jgi:hypothetical protein
VRRCDEIRRPGLRAALANSCIRRIGLYLVHWSAPQHCHRNSFVSSFGISDDAVILNVGDELICAR